MAFQLRVKFVGPCLFIVHDSNGTTNEVTVLMPDARRRTDSDLKHPDGCPAEPHTGFVRLDLSQLARGFPTQTSTDDDARYELVHRFTRQDLEFDTGATGAPVHNLPGLAFPNFDDIAPKNTKFGVVPIDNFMDKHPPAEILMRTTLRGGCFESAPEGMWALSNVLNPSGNNYEKEFASEVTWISPMIEHLTVRITDFGQSQPEAEFPLAPSADGQPVTVTVGNLCCDNPLGWARFAEPRAVTTDDDFKWLYRLLRTKGKPRLEFPVGKKLPAPIAVKRKAASQETSRSTEKMSILTSEEACMGGKITVP